MADRELEGVENKKVLRVSNKIRCRFHENEEYQLFCKDCNDLICFECLGQLHQKHDLCRLRDAEEHYRNEMRILLFEDKYARELIVLSEKVTKKKNELVLDTESLKHELKRRVKEMKHKIDLSEKQLLIDLHHSLESNQIALKEKESNINKLQTKIAGLDVNKLHEYSLSYIINTLSDIKAISSTCDNIIKHPKLGFVSSIEFSIETILENSSINLVSDVLLPTCSDTSSCLTQTYFSDDSDTEWFDAEDTEQDDLIEKSSDEIIDEYPMRFKLAPEMTLVQKIVPISEKDAWIISNRKLYKIVNYSLQDDVYADMVDDIVVLKDGCILILCVEKLFIMKLLTNRRLVKFADVGNVSIKNSFDSLFPYCFCITEDDLLVIYLRATAAYYTYYFIRIIWMTTNGIMIESYKLSVSNSYPPCFIKHLQSGLCVLHSRNKHSNLHCIELIEARSDLNHLKCDFRGIFGCDPKTTFECEGISVDKAGNIFVSDFRHDSVYVLDKELKYKKTVFDAKNGLDKPAAIGLLNDHVWLANGNQIFIFNNAYI